MKIKLNGIEIEIIGVCEDIEIHGDKVIIKTKDNSFVPFLPPFNVPWKPWLDYNKWWWSQTSTGTVSSDSNYNEKTLDNVL